ncbi:MAG: 16S rRNA (uracil(1498)-N(3))-methyltransferase [Candidatus Zixiibacteriota bacterium]|nr:MAG: 16S rRNA (uracil(1498)-N(3))-methyltransferase [candidate division Zixibacteria bacterium]
MRHPFFFAEASHIVDSEVTLSKTESHHAARILRLEKGELVVVVDGLGNAYRGAIAHIKRGGVVTVRIHSHTRSLGEPNVVLTLASGLSSGHKFDTIVEKGTELGVKRLVPLITEKSKVKLEDPKRVRTKIRRYEKVALAAMKQCGRSYRPDISHPIAFENYLREIDPDSLSLLFHPTHNACSLADIDFEAGLKRVNVIVGAESGFTEDEVAFAETRGIRVVSLGQRVLRTETAGPVVCALVMSRLGELR